MQKNKLRIYSLLLGIILLSSSYILNQYNILRVIIFFLSIILLTFSFVIEREQKKLFTFIYLIIFLEIALVGDYLVVKTFKKIPVITFNNIISNKVNVYNSIGYRVWQCDNTKQEYIIDNLYKMGYFCNSDDVNASDINTFLPEVVNNFDNYSNTFVKINGRISYISGSEYFEMQSYTKNSTSTNNQVNFAKNITLRVYFNELEQELSNFKIYDSVEIIGRIKELKKEHEEYIITMSDTSFIKTNNNNEFTIILNPKDTCEYDKTLLTTIDNTSIYTACISSIFVKFQSSENYDLSYALENKKITINMLLSKANDFKKVTENNNTLFSYDKFNILECDPNKTQELIIGTKSLNNYSPYCDIIDNMEVGV